MTDSLILDSLEIHNFRAFEHLLIEKLGRVNLIVGKNNVGKTCVLEALQLYASCGAWSLIRSILNARDEFYHISRPFSVYDADDCETEERKSTMKHLFYNPENTEKPVNLKNEGDFIVAEPIEIGQIKGKTIVVQEPLILEKGRSEYSMSDQTLYIFISDKNIINKKVTELWSNVYMTDLEEDIVNILRIIEPNIKGIGFVDDQHDEGERVAMVRLSNVKNPFPIARLGEGMNRLLGIALALVNSKDGFFLIDEIDNGIHYSVQPELWRLIFEGAKRMNVQIFATTHSWDCIEAFQQAVSQSDTDDGMLISLRRKKNTPGHVVGFIYDREDLEVVTRDRIEVR